jgi:hypothetical protein
MSHVAELDDLHVYQGEDWTNTQAFIDDDAPTVAQFANWEAYLEIRTVRDVLLVRCTTDEEDGYITRDVDDDGKPMFRVTIPKAITRTLPVGRQVTDMFVVPDDRATFPLFLADVVVSKRRTIEEGD